MVIIDWDDRLPTNIVRDGAPQDAKLVGILGEVVYEMALKYPTWQIVPVKFRSHSSSYAYPAAFNVFLHDDSRHHKKLLGEIGFEHGYANDERVAMTNKRIRKHMDRTDSLRTSKVKVAMSHIKKWFHAPTTLEVFGEAKESIHRDLHSIHREFMSKHQHQYREVSEKIHAYVMDNLASIVDTYNQSYTPKITLHSIDVAKVLSDYENAVISNSVTNAPHTKKLTVVMMDDKYVLQRGDQPLMVKTSEQLPTAIRTGMGMLKLVEPRQFIKDVGYRLNNETFMVLYDGDLDRSDDAELQTEANREA